jgi:hypothetical protein
MHRSRHPGPTHSEIVTRKRVVDHGEVFTNPREIRLMMAQIAEIKLLETRVFEPACGNGNFLYEILNAKLRNLNRSSKAGERQSQQKFVAAVASIYGIDLLKDNVLESRARLQELCEREYKRTTKTPLPTDLGDVLKHILAKNIIRGNSLTLRNIGRSSKPIVFSEWIFISRDHVKRRDYELVNLVNQGHLGGVTHLSDLKKNGVIPKPVATFPSRHFLELTVDA